MDNRKTYQIFSRPWKILGILIIISAIGCIGKESKYDSDLPDQNISEDNLGVEEIGIAQNESINMSNPNLVRLIIFRPKNPNQTGRLPIRLEILNPNINETVLTVFKPQLGNEWYNKTNVTNIINNSWTQNFTIRRIGNISYIMMFVQISENNSVVKRAAWNITFEASVGEAK